LIGGGIELKQRRNFTIEFKQESANLVLDEGYSISSPLMAGSATLALNSGE
jgi:hypothetical protein